MKARQLPSADPVGIARQAFLERGRASLARATLGGRLYRAADVLGGMRERLSIKIRDLKKSPKKP